MSVWYTAHQPLLFPSLYLVERMARVHYWVMLEEAQFDRDCVQFKLSSQDRFYERSPSVSRLAPSNGNRSRFEEMGLTNAEAFFRKTALALQTAYGKQAGYQALRPWFVDLFHDLVGCVTLNGVCHLSLSRLAELLCLDTTIFQSRDLVRQRPAEPTAWMASFCRRLHCTDYVQGRRASEAYFVKGPFEAENCRTWGQKFHCFYRSLGGRSGDATVSVLDALCMLGVEGTRKMLLVHQGKGAVGTAVELTRD